jgi:hypothetical protein
MWVWPKKEIKKMFKTETFVREQEDSDPDKNMFSIEKKRCQFEKQVFWVCLAGGILGWFFLFQDLLIKAIYNEKLKVS